MTIISVAPSLKTKDSNFIKYDIETLRNKLGKEISVGYETFGTDTWIKPMFDIDFKNDGNMTLDQYNGYLQKIYHFICMEFNCEMDDIYTSNAHRDDKFSSHIVIGNKKCKMSSLISWKNDKKKILKELNIDPAIYRKGKKRLVLCKKEDKNGEIMNNPLIPVEENYDVKNHIVTYVDGIDDEWEYVSTKLNNDVCIDYDNIKKIGNINIDNESVIEKLLDILDSKYYDDYDYWIKVLIALKNSNVSSSIAMSFSAKSSKFNSTDFDKTWNSIKPNGSISLGSIYYFAFDSDSKRYFEIISYGKQKEDNPPDHGVIFDYIVETHKDYRTEDGIATLYDFIINKTNSKYQCITTGSDEWYFFDGDNWIDEELGSGVIYYKCLDVIREALQHVFFISYNIDKKASAELWGLIDATKFGSKQFKKAFFVKCYQKDLKSKLDSNIFLTGFKNGVFDIRTGVVRQKKWNDFITYNTHVEYHDIELDRSKIDLICNAELRNAQIERYNNYHDLLSFLKKIFACDENLYEYVLELFGSMFYGMNNEEKLHSFIGKGGNGKSKLLSLLSNTIGDYHVVCSKNIITYGKQESGEELMALKGGRSYEFGEIAEGARLKDDLIKQITGNDNITGRKIYKSQTTFKPTGKTIYVSNHQLECNSVDDGLWRRIVVVPFLSTFRDVVNNKINYCYPIDKEIDYKIKNYWKEPFLYLLTKYARKYYNDRIVLKKGLIPPEICLKHTQDFKNSSDPYQEWINESIEKDDNSYIKMSDLWENFTHSHLYSKKDHKQKGLKSVLISRFEFKEEYMVNKKKLYSCFIGIKFKDNEIDDPDQTPSECYL